MLEGGITRTAPEAADRRLVVGAGRAEQVGGDPVPAAGVGGRPRRFFSAADGVLGGEAFRPAHQLEHLLLVATTYFVHASFATNVLENPTTRHDLRRALDLPGYPQMLMRLGYTGTQRHTPRRRVEEIITSTRPAVPGSDVPD